jgi:hypothetical protein
LSFKLIYMFRIPQRGLPRSASPRGQGKS